MNGNDATLAVIDALDSLGIPYMLVGSYSSNFYGVPRSTADADFVIDLGAESVWSIAARLGPRFCLDPQMAFESATGTARHNIDVPEIPFAIELFRLSDDPHDQERFRRRQRISLWGRQIAFPSVEDVVVTKLRWSLHASRAKDRDDVRDVIAVQGDRIDWEYVYSWCDQHGTRPHLDEIRASIPPV